MICGIQFQADPGKLPTLSIIQHSEPRLNKLWLAKLCPYKASTPSYTHYIKYKTWWLQRRSSSGKQSTNM